MRTAFDTIVIGAGVVGACIAFGLQRAGQSVCMVDEGDAAFRAARGNFGLVWVQGKGAEHLPYAQWTLQAAAAWRAFAEGLQACGGTDVDYSQVGGLTYCLDDAELAQRSSRLASLQQRLGDWHPYPFEILSAAELRRIVPHSGPDVAGAVMTPMDGHVSPLKLLRSLFEAFAHLGGTLVTAAPVSRLGVLTGGGFEVTSGARTFEAGKLVLAAGLGNRVLAPWVGLEAPVKPVRGQLLVTERLLPFLRFPTLHVRQTGEGTVQIGDSKEDVGLDDGTTLVELSRIAARAVRCFPMLAHVNVVRTWGALRVMTPDGLPVYAESSRHPGAFVITCHSGITLAPLHAGPVCDWIRGGSRPEAMSTFSADRFDVQTH